MFSLLAVGVQAVNTAVHTQTVAAVEQVASMKGPDCF
jgi:hypothetical protein